MKIHQTSKIRTLLPYYSVNVIVDFEGSEEEWQKVKKDVLPEFHIG